MLEHRGVSDSPDRGFVGRNPERFFETAHLRKDLSRRSVRGGAFTGAGQGAQMAIKIVAVGVMARILTPEDFGLIAMMTVVVGFLGIFSDAGLGSATIQRERITHAQVSNLFWVNAAMGCLLASVLFASAPLIAAFYGDARIVGIARGLSASFVFSGFMLQHQALMRRQMRFESLAIRAALGIALGCLVGIVMAYCGMGYWSLVGMTLSSNGFTMLSMWSAIPWAPSLPRPISLM